MSRLIAILAGVALAFALPVDMPGHGSDGDAVAGPGKRKHHKRPKAKQPTPAPAPDAAPTGTATATGTGTATGTATGTGAATGTGTGAATGTATATGTGTATGTATGTGTVPVPSPFAPTAPTPAPDLTVHAPGTTLPSPEQAATAIETARPVTVTSDAHGGFVADMDCSACHTADGWSLSAGAGSSGFDHDRTGFALRGAHVQQTCTGCHNSDAKLATTCEGCHADPHQGRMDGECAECHQATAWTDTDALDLHRRTRMPLTGRHATVDCIACHTRQTDRTWTDLPTDCYACHRADYERTDIHPLHTGDPNNPGTPPLSRDCARCHRTAAWAPAVIDPGATPRTAADAAALIDHDAWFVLSSGPHQGTDCTSCHADRRRTQRTRCDGCHTADAVAVQHPGRTVARTSRSCLRCHPRGAR